MMYLFGLIGIIVGFIIGVFLMKTKTQKTYQKKIFHNNILETKINKLNKRQKELKNYFNQNMHLLNTITKNHQELYQNMIKNSNIPYQHIHNNIYKETSQKQNIQSFENLTKNKNSNNNQLLIQEPRDYPDNKNYPK